MAVVVCPHCGEPLEVRSITKKDRVGYYVQRHSRREPKGGCGRYFAVTPQRLQEKETER